MNRICCRHLSTVQLHSSASQGRVLLIAQRATVPLFLLLFCSTPTTAHIGSPDVFFEGAAGPYRLFVTVRVPVVIPGVADIEIRSESTDVRDIRIVPLRLTGPGSNLPPTPDVAKRSTTDRQFFTGAEIKEMKL